MRNLSTSRSPFENSKLRYTTTKKKFKNRRKEKNVNHETPPKKKKIINNEKNKIKKGDKKMKRIFKKSLLTLSECLGDGEHRR